MLPSGRPDPVTLGRQLALGEHELFMQEMIGAIDGFAHWGVELGNSLAVSVVPALAGGIAGLDGSTAGLISAPRSFRAASAKNG